MKISPAKKIKLLKKDVKIEVVNDEQINQMLSFYRRVKRREKSFCPYSYYMIIVTILGTGIR